MNYAKLMATEPTKLGEITNNLNQLIEFYEHPLRGDESPVIAVCHDMKLAELTDFYELDDMTATEEDYRPMFVDGALRMGYEFM
jgi:hypothetical protein